MIDLEVRLARREDTDAVLNFCANTWDNQKDFVLSFWEKWISDPKGLFVATANDTPVGLIKLDILSHNEAWSKAWRVAIDYRRKGISKALEAYSNQYLAARGIDTIRTCVYKDNETMIRLMANSGRKVIDTYFHYSADSLGDRESKLVLLQPEQLDIIWNQINDFKLLKDRQKLYTILITKFQKLTLEILKKHLKDNKVWGLFEGDILTAIAIQGFTEVAKDKMIYFGYLEAKDRNTFTILLSELRRLAASKNFQSVRSIFLNNDTSINSLDIADYQRANPKAELNLYEWNINI